MQTWGEAQKWEAEWHDNCINSYNEETKQYIYARFLGLDEYKFNYYGQVGWDFKDKSVLDIGCGPYSILLKSKGKSLEGIDPCSYPEWVYSRYNCAGINVHKIPAEDFNTDKVYDEVLIYNCLQHVINPWIILHNARKFSKVIRIFEWIENGISDGHLHDLYADDLDRELGGYGMRNYIDIGPCVGKAFWGIFKGYHF